MTNKLTIITINRNNAQNLRKTIKSVLSQTFTAFEYIVIDGLSTDGSVEVIKEYGHRISNWISEADSSVYQAMNKGILMATGKYLLFINSGDFLIDETVLERVFSKEYTADILCGRCNISDKGKVIHTTNPPELVTFGTLYFTGLAHQATLIKKKLFDKLGLYDETFKYNADIEFWYRSIIFGSATTQKIDIIISDYNLDGISSQQNQTAEFKKEHERILAHPLLIKIVPDYEKLQKESNELVILKWVKSKSLLFYPIKLIYKTVRCINGK